MPFCPNCGSFVLSGDNTCSCGTDMRYRYRSPLEEEEINTLKREFEECQYYGKTNDLETLINDWEKLKEVHEHAFYLTQNISDEDEIFEIERSVSDSTSETIEKIIRIVKSDYEFSGFLSDTFIEKFLDKYGFTGLENLDKQLHLFNKDLFMLFRARILYEYDEPKYFCFDFLD